MIDLPAELSAMQLAKPAESGSVPPARLSDPNKASQMVWLLIYANQERSRVDARVKGMLDGNAPYSFDELKRQGQTYRTNVNFREGEAILSAAVTPFYDLFAEADTYAKVEVNERDPDKRASYSRIVTQRFDELLKSWAGFDWNTQAMINDMVGFGKGFVMWPNRSNWQYRAIAHTRVLVPDQTPSDPDQLELLVVRESLPVHDLYGRIRNNEAAKAMGWDVAATLGAIGRAMPEYDTDNARVDYELLQKELRNHDLYQTVKSSVIKIAHIFVREFDGKVSHLIVEERYPSKDGKVPGGEFLFKKIGRFDSFRQVVGCVFYDIGDGTWHSIKGLAIKLNPFIEIKNRLNCSIVDNAFINMSVLTRPTTARAAESMAIMQLGPLSVLPPNLEVTQWGIAGRMEEGLAIEQSLSNRLESNIGQYRRPMTRERGNPPTARQVSFDASKEAMLSKGAVNRFYGQMDMIFEEVYRRASDSNLIDDNGGPNSMALEFQSKCQEDGVPAKCLRKPNWVRASRNMGNGSVFMRQQTIQDTSILVPMLNEAGKQNWIDSAISVMAGSENVARWNPKQSVTPSLENDQALATLENAVLSLGSPVMMTRTQNPVVHSAVHLKAASDAVNSIKQGGDPAHVASFLDAVGAHVAQHLVELEKDPMHKQLAGMVKSQLQQLGKMTQQLHGELAQQQQQQQQAVQAQQQVMNAEQLKAMETQNKISLSRAKTQEAITQKQQKHEQALAINEEKTQQAMALADARTAAELTRKHDQAD